MAQSICSLFETRHFRQKAELGKTFCRDPSLTMGRWHRWSAALGVRRWSISLVLGRKVALLTAVVLTAHIGRGERTMLSLNDVSAVSKVSGISKASLVCHPSPYLNVNLVPFQYDSTERLGEDIISIQQCIMACT